MAMIFEDDRRRLQCACGNRRIYKRDVNTYLRHGNDENTLEEHLIETELRCDRCDKVVKVIKPGRDKILS